MLDALPAMPGATHIGPNIIMHRFHDRQDAGRALATHLEHYKHSPGLVVLALPRGGVPVAAEVARALDAPLDVLVVRKLASPLQPELALGAIASGDVVVINDDLVRSCHVSQATLDDTLTRERQEVLRREHRYRGDRPRLALTGRTVILVDDGIATGADMEAAIRAVERRGPARCIVAVPVSSHEALERVRPLATDTICLGVPDDFRAVAMAYDSFEQTADDDVIRLLSEAEHRMISTANSPTDGTHDS